MRIIRTLAAVGAVAATATALAVAPALADPVNSHYKSVTPKSFDVVGVGSDTTQYLLDQLSTNYNAAQAKRHVSNSSKNPYIYSWDAVPINNEENQMQLITTKAGCGGASQITRPDGSGAGLKAIVSPKLTSGHPCVNFARSSRDRSATDEQQGGPGGNVFIALARDAISYATSKTSNAPNGLSIADLKAIFGCTVAAANGDPADSWGALLGNGKNVPDPTALFDPIIPQLSSGTLQTFYTALGLGTPAGEPSCSSAKNLTGTQLPEENEGTDPAFYYENQNDENVANPNVIFPFSIGSYIEQAYHSRLRGHSLKKGQDRFGYDQTGVLYLRSVGKTAPTVGSGKNTTINPKFASGLFRTLYDVVEYSAATKNHIPAYLQRFFDPTGAAARHLKVKAGAFCSKANQSVIKAYGFLPTPLCGATH